MSEKITSNYSGVSYSKAHEVRDFFEESLFYTYPFLNTLCIKEFSKNKFNIIKKYGLVAGVTKVINTDKSNLFIKNIRENPTTFPSFLEVSKSELNPEKTNYIKGFINKIAGNSFNKSTKKIRIPITQKTNTEFFAQKNDYRERPLKSGVAIGNPKYRFSGTLGSLCKIKGQDGVYLISNWHVLVGPNGKIDDYIIQPNSDLGGKTVENQDFIAKLVWYRLDKYMDVAIAKIDNSIPFFKAEKKIKTTEPKTNMVVTKNNFKSNLKGKIISTNCTVKVKGDSYPGKQIILRNQIISEKISSPSDSGSLVTDTVSKKVIGIIVGGDNKFFSVICPLDFTKPIVPFHSKHYDNSKIKKIEIEAFI